jgi:hypothetical protein
MKTMNRETTEKLYFSIVTIFAFTVAFIIFITLTITGPDIDPNQSAGVAYAQMSLLNGNTSLAAMIGNITLPSNNDTATTSGANATGTNATGIQTDLLAQNITSANVFTKENTTTPISPTGISTQAERAPPSNRIVNNTVSTANAINTNITTEGAMTPASSEDNNMTGKNNGTNTSKGQTMNTTANTSGNNSINQGVAPTTTTKADQQQQLKNDTANPLTDLGKKIGDIFGQGSSK